LTLLSRRRFLGCGLLLPFASLARRVWAQAPALRFRRLARPVLVPLADVAVPWQPQPFVAQGVTLPSAATPNQPIQVAGMVARTGSGNEPARFGAVCLRCPHEGCDVDFQPDATRLPQEVRDEIGGAVLGAVYVCPCHNSTFAAADGQRLAGPAPRGLYRFRVTAVSDAAVEIGEVEEDVLIFV
jgi:Rieske Fe-S protein